jgi:hypothetical protein
MSNNDEDNNNIQTIYKCELWYSVSTNNQHISKDTIAAARAGRCSPPDWCGVGSAGAYTHTHTHTHTHTCVCVCVCVCVCMLCVCVSVLVCVCIASSSSHLEHGGGPRLMFTALTVEIVEKERSRSRVPSRNAVSHGHHSGDTGYIVCVYYI